MRATKQNIDIMTQAYIEAAIWSSTMDNEEPFDSQYSIDNICPQSYVRCMKACVDFCELARGLLAKWTPDQAGHDLWLSRNGHGTGFFDRTHIDTKEICQALQQLTNRLGERYCYTLDDNTFGIE